MPWIQVLVLAAIFAVPTSLLLALIWTKSGEQCPERDPDLSEDDRAYMRAWSQSNRWEA